VLVENFQVTVGVLLGVVVAVTGIYVFVARADEDAGPRDGSSFERRVGNVLVHYGGSDRSVLTRVRATIAQLR
jgi:hypothetical protein